ncbi:MAG TPA: TAXI family TRAP transporter solute-binding subunit [Desulfatiglandales bacterium]|nr:TAXI family TRAP transporter solute-binding subunit [Desulfatiglandales bacterium]
MRFTKLIFRFFCITFISIFLLGFIFLGVEEAKAAKFISIKSSSLGGSWYAGGAAWAKLISDNYPEYIAINVAAPGLDNESLKRLARKECQLVFLTGPGAYNAYKGVPPTWKRPQDIRGLFGLWPGVINTIVMADSKFKKLQDLKGASIATYVPGDINGEQVLACLKHHGITEKNTKFYRIMKADASRMFIDKRVDSIMYYFGHGHANLKEIAASRKIRFLAPDSEMVKGFMKENPFYYLGDFGEEFGVQNANQLIGPYLTACRADASVDIIYKVVKVWFDNLDWLKIVLPSNIPYMNVKDPHAGVPLPMHPGAEKYFKEVGLIK